MKGLWRKAMGERRRIVTAALGLAVAALCVYFAFHGLANGRQLLEAWAALPWLPMAILWGVATACLITGAMLCKEGGELAWLNLCLMSLCAYLALIGGDWTAALAAAALWAIEGFLALRQLGRRSRVAGLLVLPQLLLAWYLVILLYDVAMR